MPGDPTRKVKPYEHLDDSELNLLVDQAVDLRLRLAMLSPGQVAERMIEYGCPARDARAQVVNPQLRTFAARFYLDTDDAKMGDREAAKRVEHVRRGWADLARRQAIAEMEQAS